MAEVLSEYTFKRGTYPDWTKFFDGNIHRLQAGVDFQGDSRKAQSSIYQAAKRADKKVQSQREGDDVLVIRVV